MRWRRVIKVLALAVVVIATTWFVRMLRRQESADLLSHYLQQLDEETHPQARLNAIEQILRLDPQRNDSHRNDLLIKQAQTLIVMARYEKAREALSRLMPSESDQPSQIQAFILRADSCLREAADWIAGSTVNGLATTTKRSNQLLAQAQEAVDQLNEYPDTAYVVNMLKARRVSAQAALLRLELEVQKVEFAKARAADFDEQAAQFGVVVAQLKRKIRLLGNELIDLCEQAIADDPADPLPRELLFQMWADTERFDDARRVAGELADLPSLNDAVAGRVANVLLNMESLYARQTTADDIQIVVRLLEHPGLSGDKDIEFRVAQVTLAMHRRDYESAEQLARDVLELYPGHPKAMCLLALALVKQGRGDQAVDLLLSFNDRVTSPYVRYALGVAMLSIDRSQNGREMLRQTLDMQPMNLRARLALAQSLVDEGFVLEAEPDILRAVSLAGDHWHVIQLQVRLLIRRMDREELLDLLGDQFAQGAKPLGWRHAAIVAAMAVDDTAQVTGLVAQQLEEDPADVIAMIGVGWLHAAPSHRVDIAGFAVRVLLGMLDSDPLARTDPPAIGVFLDHPTAQTPVGVDIDPIIHARFVPWPKQQALDLVDAALARWPGQPVLLDQGARLSLWAGRSDAVVGYLDRLERSGAAPSEAALAVRAFVRGENLDVASALGLDRGGDERSGVSPTIQLVMLADALRRGDRASAENTLTEILVQVPWPEQALLRVVRDALQQGDSEKVSAWLEIARQVNSSAALLTQARVDLALGQPNDAMHTIRLLLRSEQDGASELSRYASEVLARTYILLDQTNLAMGVFEDLALSARDQKLEMRIAMIDTLIETQQREAAIAALTAFMAHDDIPARLLDGVLVRAKAVMSAKDLIELIDEKHAIDRENPLRLLYKATCLSELGEDEAARKVVQRVLKGYPRATRAQIAMARLAVRQGRWDEAGQLYERLIAQGGAAAEIGRHELEQLHERKTLKVIPDGGDEEE